MIPQQLHEVINSFKSRHAPPVEPENGSNPYDEVGRRHNEILAHIADNLPAVIIRGRLGINRTRTAEAIEAIATSTSLQPGPAPLVKHLNDVRPRQSDLFEIADDPFRFLRRVYSEGGISEAVHDAMLAYLTAARLAPADVAAFVEMSRHAEESVASVKLDDDRARLLIAFAIGRYSSVYWFGSQESILTKWIIPTICPFTDPEPQFAKVNWWKVLACDCIVGACSGGNPVVAAGGSACSVVGQL